MKTDNHICAECNKKLVISEDREECLDMCDNCYDSLNERVKYMSDYDNRMAITRASVAWRDQFFHSNQKEANYRSFFASVMPEMPHHKVEDFIRKNR